jgi:8-oxo-dGTP pyrophosphatase MutT (NUDIX family)
MPAAVLVPVVAYDGGERVILTKRTAHLSNHAGQVSFPGGRVDAEDPDVIATALRETEEEIGLDRGHISILGALDAYVTGTGFAVVPVVGLVKPGFSLHLAQHEVAEVFEVPFDFLMSAAHLHQVEIDFRGRRRSVLEYDWPGQRIWGATAAILYNLRRRLEEGA